MTNKCLDFLLVAAASPESASAPSISESSATSSVSSKASSITPTSASSTSGPSLGAEDAALASGGPGASAPPPASAAHVLQHRRVLEHVGEDHEADLGAPDVDVLQLGHPPVPVGHGHARHLAVHVVLGLDKLSSINLQNIISEYKVKGHKIQF